MAGVGRTLLREAGIMGVELFARRRKRVPALALLFTHHFEECDRHETSSRGNERIARFVPLGVIFPTQNVKEVALVKRQLLSISILWLVVVECFDDLLGWEGLDRLWCNG